MNFKIIINEVFERVEALPQKGELATYIPQLAQVNSSKFGVHLSTIHGLNYGIGDYNDRFSIQSISKVLSLSLAYKLVGESIWQRLGVEPSGTAFNSLVQLEADKGIPRNPFINAGAIVVADILLSTLKNPRKDFLEFIHTMSPHSNVNYSKKVAESEKKIGFRNTALCNLIKSFGNIENKPNKVLDFYFDICSLETNCKELSDLFLFFANEGCTNTDQNRILTKSQTKRMNALMQTCGFYDESGEFAFKVGLPGKSGVGGGIVALHPGKYSIAVWSPKLNAKGNSYKGIKFLEEFTSKTEMSIF